MGASIHIWTITLDEEPSMVGSLADVLSGDERVRAARLRTTELRVRFVVAHGALRTILSGYLGIPPKAVRFDTTETGKPFVPGAGLTFNLSRSEGLALCAITVEGRSASTSSGCDRLRMKTRSSIAISLPARCVSTKRREARSGRSRSSAPGPAKRRS